MRLKIDNFESPHTLTNTANNNQISIKAARNHNKAYDLAFVMESAEDEPIFTDLYIDLELSNVEATIEFVDLDKKLGSINYKEPLHYTIMHTKKIIVGISFNLRIKIKFAINEIRIEQLSLKELQTKNKQQIGNFNDFEQLEEQIRHINNQTILSVDYKLYCYLYHLKFPDYFLVDDERLLERKILSDIVSIGDLFPKYKQIIKNLNRLQYNHLTEAGSSDKDFLIELRSYLKDQIKIIDSMLDSSGDLREEINKYEQELEVMSEKIYNNITLTLS